jgi:signal transduction histidine kinase
LLESKGLILSLEIPSEEIIIEVDEERLLQALDSIIDNSIKFTEKGGRIKVILNNLYREVEIVISDTGMGIPAKDLPYLFQKFFRVNRPDSDIPGAGMGLVFVKQIVDLHQGLINIQSEPNKGTTVLIKLLKNNRD